MPENLFTYHDSTSGRTLTVEAGKPGQSARLRLDAPGMPAISIPVEAEVLIEAAGALSTWTLEREGDVEP